MKPSDASDNLNTRLVKARAALGDVVAIDYLKQHRDRGMEAAGNALEQANLQLRDAFKLYNMTDITAKLGAGHATLKDIPEMVNKLSVFQKSNIPPTADAVKALQQISAVFAVVGTHFSKISKDDYKLKQPNKSVEVQAEEACAGTSAQLDSLVEYAEALKTKHK